ncbi:hypothetical protein CPY51_20770 [Rhizobium tubonense]|uniref:Uncharacterized protein n=1 Tax=Rhizobium tubonense TaxID=484088 RepID=A0A2W4EHV2_9HYPH|nr:hypothetical protein CPY51_20770 [Rhizobium tubonense]
MPKPLPLLDLLVVDFLRLARLAAMMHLYNPDRDYRRQPFRKGWRGAHVKALPQFFWGDRQGSRQKMTGGRGKNS